jgi:predicted O-methyltransferase YrrM
MWKRPAQVARPVAAPEFSSDWFSRYIPAWESFFGTVGWNAAEPRTVIEIGSFEGRSALWMLDHLIQHPRSYLHCVDTFPDHDRDDSYGARFRRNMATSPRRDQCGMHAMTSAEFLLSYAAEGGTADFIYLDGSHQAADVLQDLVLAFRIIKPGGLIICDDYLGGGPGDVLQSPKIAIDAFTTIFRDKLSILSPQPLYQLAFTKTADLAKDDPTSRGA